MLIAAAEAFVPALPAQGVAIYYRDAEGGFVRVAQAGREAPLGMLEPMLAGLGPDRDALESRSEAGCLLVRATRYQDGLNGALCLWRAATATLLGEEESALPDEVSAQIGVTNQQMAREEE
jgi:hypothetical protein